MQASSTNSEHSSRSTKGKRRLPAAFALRALQAWIATLKMRILKMVICFRSSDMWTRSPARSEVSYRSDDYWESPQPSLSQILGYTVDDPPASSKAVESPPAPLSPKISSPSSSNAEFELLRDALKYNYSEPDGKKPSLQKPESAIVPVVKPRAEKRVNRCSVLQGYPGDHDSPEDSTNFGCLPRAKRNKYTRETSSREDVSASCLPRRRKEPKVDLEQINRLLREKRVRERTNALIAWRNEDLAHAKRLAVRCRTSLGLFRIRDLAEDNSQGLDALAWAPPEAMLLTFKHSSYDFIANCYAKRPKILVEMQKPTLEDETLWRNSLRAYHTVGKKRQSVQSSSKESFRFSAGQEGYFLPTRHEGSAPEVSPRTRKSGNMLLDDDRLSRQEPVATSKHEAEDEGSGAPDRHTGPPDRQQQSPENGKFDGHEFRNWKSHEGMLTQNDQTHAGTFGCEDPSTALYHGDNSGYKGPYRPPYPGSQASNQPWNLGSQASGHFFNPRHHGPGPWYSQNDDRTQQCLPTNLQSPRAPRQDNFDSPSKSLSQSASPRTPHAKVAQKFLEHSSTKPYAERNLSSASRKITSAVSSEKYFHDLERVLSEKPLAKKPVAVKNMHPVSDGLGTKSKAQRSPKSRPQQAPMGLAAHPYGTKRVGLVPSIERNPSTMKDMPSRFHKPRKFHSNKSPDYEDFHFNVEQVPKKAAPDQDKVMPYDLDAIAAQLKDEGHVFSEPIVVMNVNSSIMFPIITDSRGRAQVSTQIPAEESISKQSVDFASPPQEDGNSQESHSSTYSDAKDKSQGSDSSTYSDAKDKSQGSDSSTYSDAKDGKSQGSDSTNYSDSREDFSSSKEVGEGGGPKEAQSLQTTPLDNASDSQGHTFSDAITSVTSTISLIGSKTGDETSSSSSDDDDTEHEPFYSSRDSTKDEANQMPSSADPTSASSESSQLEEGPSPRIVSETERSSSYDPPLQDVTTSASDDHSPEEDDASLKVQTPANMRVDALLQLKGEERKAALVTDYNPELLAPFVTDTVQTGFGPDIVVTPPEEIVKTSIDREVMDDHHKIAVHPKEEMYHRRRPMSGESLIKPSPPAGDLAHPQPREEPAKFNTTSQPPEDTLKKPVMMDESTQVDLQPEKQSGHEQQVSSETHMLVSIALRPSMKDEGTQFSAQPAVSQQESQQQIPSEIHMPESSALCRSTKDEETQFSAKPAVSHQEGQQHVSSETHMPESSALRPSLKEEGTRISAKAAVSEQESPDEYSRPLARPSLNDNGIPFSKPGLYQVLEPPENTSGGRVLATSLSRPVVVPEVISQDVSLKDPSSPSTVQSMAASPSTVSNESLSSSRSGVSTGRRSIIPLSEDSAQGNPLHIKIHSFLHSMASRSRSVELNNLILEELSKTPTLMDGRSFEGQLDSDELDPSFVTPDSEDLTSSSMGNSNDADQDNVLEQPASGKSRPISVSSVESFSSATDSETHDSVLSLESPKSEVSERNTRTQLDTNSQSTEESFGPKLNVAKLVDQASKHSSGSPHTEISLSSSLQSSDLGRVVKEFNTPGVLHPGEIDPSTLVSMSTTDPVHIPTRPVEESAELSSASLKPQSSSLTEQTITDPASDLEIPATEDQSKGPQHIKIHSFLHSMASRSRSVELDNLLSGKFGESSTQEEPRAREGSLLNSSASDSTSRITRDVANPDSTNILEKVVERSTVQSATGKPLNISSSTTDIESLNNPSVLKDPASLNKPENEDRSTDAENSAAEEGSKSPKHIKIHSFLHSMTSRSRSVELDNLILGQESRDESSTPEEPRTREGSILNPSSSLSSPFIRQNSTYIDPTSVEKIRESSSRDSTGESSTPEEPRSREGSLLNPSSSRSSSVIKQKSTYIDPTSVEKVGVSSTQDSRGESQTPEEPRSREESILNPSSSRSSTILRQNSSYIDPPTAEKMRESSTQDPRGESQTPEGPIAREGSTILNPSSSRSPSILKKNSTFIDPTFVAKFRESGRPDSDLEASSSLFKSDLPTNPPLSEDLAKERQSKGSKHIKIHSFLHSMASRSRSVELDNLILLGKLAKDSAEESLIPEEPRTREGSTLNFLSSVLRKNSTFIDPTIFRKNSTSVDPSSISMTPEEPRTRQGSTLNPSSSRSSSILGKDSNFIDPSSVTMSYSISRSSSSVSTDSISFDPTHISEKAGSDIMEPISEPSVLNPLSVMSSSLTTKTESANQVIEDQTPTNIKNPSSLQSTGTSTSMKRDSLRPSKPDSTGDLSTREEHRIREKSVLGPSQATASTSVDVIKSDLPTSVSEKRKFSVEEVRERGVDDSLLRKSLLSLDSESENDLESKAMEDPSKRPSHIKIHAFLHSMASRSRSVELDNLILGRFKEDPGSEPSVQEDSRPRERSILNPSSSRSSSAISLNSSDFVSTPTSERLMPESIQPSSDRSTFDPSSLQSSSLSSRNSIVPDSRVSSETPITNVRQASFDGSVLDPLSPRSPSRLSMKPIGSDSTPNLKKLIEGLQVVKPSFDSSPSEISGSVTTRSDLRQIPDSKSEAVKDESRSPKHIKIHSFLHSMASRPRSVELDNLILSAKLGENSGGESSAPGPEESRSREGSILNPSNSHSASIIAIDMASIDPRLKLSQESRGEPSTGGEARSREGSAYTPTPSRSASSVSMDMANLDPSNGLFLKSRGELSYDEEARTREASVFSPSPSRSASSISMDMANLDPSRKFAQESRDSTDEDLRTLEEEIRPLEGSLMNPSTSSSSTTVINSADKPYHDPTAKSERGVEDVKKLNTTNVLPDDSRSRTSFQRLSTDQSSELNDRNPENSPKSPKHIKIHSFLHSMAARSRSVELDNLITAGGNPDAPDTGQLKISLEPSAPTPQDPETPDDLSSSLLSTPSQQVLEPTASGWLPKWKNDRFADFPPAPLSKVSRNDGEEPPPTTPSSGPPSTPPDQVEFLQAFWGRKVHDSLRPLDTDDPAKFTSSSTNYLQKQ